MIGGRIDRGRALSWLALACLVAASAYLAHHRIYQVDELENAYSARIVALGKQRELATSATLLVLPLAPIAGSTLSSAEQMDAYRLLFTCVMWLNVFLLVRATRIPLSSGLGVVVALLAATVPALWDYGFELRHDNLLILGMLASFCLAKPAVSASPWAYAALGAVAVIMQFTAFKAFLYFVPLSLVLLAFPHPAHVERHGRARLVLQFLAGVAVTFALLLLLYRGLGLWEVWRDGFLGGTRISQQVKRQGHLSPLLHLASEAPLLLALSLSAFAYVAHGLYTRPRELLSWSSLLPETLLGLFGAAVFFVNPTPYRYNLVPLSLLLFLPGARLLYEQRERLAAAAPRALLLGVVVFCHVAPFMQSVGQTLALDNARQKKLMTLAERLTDPDKDRVYAASGLVITRDSIGYRWFLHTLNIKHFYDGTYPTVRSMLEKNPPSVFIPSYRTDWLKKPERDLISSRYVPLADDFWVLGQLLPEGSGTFQCVHPGRYHLMRGKSKLQIDGTPFKGGIRHFDGGPHRIESNTKLPTLIRWVGPREKKLPKIKPGVHWRLFVSDY